MRYSAIPGHSRCIFSNISRVGLIYDVLCFEDTDISLGDLVYYDRDLTMPRSGPVGMRSAKQAVRSWSFSFVWVPNAIFFLFFESCFFG